MGRNTALAVAVAAHVASDKEDPVLLVLAADHAIVDVDEFATVVKKALPLTESGKLVTFGIVPTSAHIGYGYIKRGEEVSAGFAVESFVEKPDVITAGEYFASKEYYWNSGMFLFKASRYLEELYKYRPDIAEACESAVQKLSKDLDFIRFDESAFFSCPDESIDYTVMEHAKDAVIVSLGAGWNDI